MPVPWRGWGNIPVRVCDSCYEEEAEQSPKETELKTSASVKLEISSQGKKKKTKNGMSRETSMKCDEMEVLDAENSGISTGKNEEDGKGLSSSGVTARYVGEVMQSAVGLASGVLQYSKEVLVETARPAYWEADADVTSCRKCQVKFDPKNSLHCTKHHCRACGKGFCDACSSYKEMVPDRGWDYPVRVCEACAKKLQQSRYP